MEAKYQALATIYQQDDRWIQPATVADCCKFTKGNVRKETLAKIVLQQSAIIESLKAALAPQAELRKWEDITAAIRELSLSDDVPAQEISDVLNAAGKAHLEMLSRQTVDQMPEKDRFLWNHFEALQTCMQTRCFKDAFLSSFDETVANARLVEAPFCIDANQIEQAKNSKETRTTLLANIVRINHRRMTNGVNSFPAITAKLIEWAQRLSACNEKYSVDDFQGALAPIRDTKNWCEGKLAAKKAKMVESCDGLSCSIGTFDNHFSYYISLQTQIEGIEACIEGIGSGSVIR